MLASKPYINHRYYCDDCGWTKFTLAELLSHTNTHVNFTFGSKHLKNVMSEYRCRLCPHLHAF